MHIPLQVILTNALESFTQYVKAARPIQLSKTMIGIGLGLYCANANHIRFTYEALVIMIGIIVLWAGLYGLNDIADLPHDARTVYKRFRPLPMGKISLRALFYVSTCQIAVALLTLSSISSSVALIGVGLVINQVVYSLEPFRLKRRFVLDVISAAVLTHGARFVVGLAGGPYQKDVWFAATALILWKVATYLAYRLEDAPGGRVGVNGTVALLGERLTIAFSGTAIIASYMFLAIYAVQTHLPFGVFVGSTFLYITMISLYVVFRRGTYLKTLTLTVFSATGPSNNAPDNLALLYTPTKRLDG